MQIMTHGETWFLKARSKDIELSGDGYCLSITGLPPRMGHKEASVYYRNKIRSFFEQNLTIKSFDKVEDYFGYFEALKIRNKIENIPH
jgi:hypothetical protein